MKIRLDHGRLLIMNKTLKNALIHYAAEFYRLEIEKLGYDNHKLNQYFQAIEEMFESIAEGGLTENDALTAYFHGPIYTFLYRALKKFGTPNKEMKRNMNLSY